MNLAYEHEPKIQAHAKAWIRLRDGHEQSDREYQFFIISMSIHAQETRNAHAL
jgi:hypothetical protein